MCRFRARHVGREKKIDILVLMDGGLKIIGFVFVVGTLSAQIGCTPDSQKGVPELDATALASTFMTTVNVDDLLDNPSSGATCSGVAECACANGPTAGCDSYEYDHPVNAFVLTRSGPTSGEAPYYYDCGGGFPDGPVFTALPSTAAGTPSCTTYTMTYREPVVQVRMAVSAVNNESADRQERVSNFTGNGMAAAVTIDGSLLAIKQLQVAGSEVAGVAVSNANDGQGTIVITPSVPSSVVSFDICQYGTTDSNGVILNGMDYKTTLDVDGDGVDKDADIDDNNPLACRDVDGDGCDDCSVTGADGSGGDASNDGPDLNGDGACDVNDKDGDGIDNNVDIDDDNDGILDIEEGGVDTDGDGVTDDLDLDSDDDGILDAVEAGHSIGDSNGDGLVDCPGGVGANGFCDALESAPDSGVPVYTPGSAGPDEPVDTDLDTVPDYRDLDSDNDGIPDTIEGAAGCLDSPVNAVCDGDDIDGDGIVDDLDNVNGHGTSGHPAPPDTDQDSVEDFRDLDSDDDGLFDVDESQNGDLDADNDGMIDGPETDGDGIIDAVDNQVGHGGAQDTTIDTDGDGAPDHLDTDSDDDGIPDGGVIGVAGGGLAGGAGCSSTGTLGGLIPTFAFLLLWGRRRFSFGE